MSLKYTKQLIVISLINVILGAFLIFCGILEYTGLLTTNANTSISTIGIRLAHLVFISGILVFLCGGFTIIERKSMRFISIQMLLGIIALAWPIFISVSLFVSQRYICIRLLPTMLSSVIYVVGIIVVRITNAELNKSHKIVIPFNLDNKRKNLDVTTVLKNGIDKKKSSADISIIGDEIASRLTKNRGVSFNSGALYSGRRPSGANPLKKIFKGKKPQRGGWFKRLYSGQRHRRKHF